MGSTGEVTVAKSQREVQPSGAPPMINVQENEAKEAPER